MNKTAIKNFAIWARNKLIADIHYRAGLLGITAEGIANPLPQSTGDTEFYDIGTAEPYSIHGQAVKQRKRLVELLNKKAEESDYATAYKYVLEEVAYTWFNRLIAVRFMEVNDYLPSHIRVLSSESGKVEPDLVTMPFDADLEFTETERASVIQMKQDNQLDELFRLLFIKECNALNEILPALFEKTNDYTELLLSISAIDKEGVVYHLVNDIPEEDFDVEKGGQVEIIGWLYQYYISEQHDEIVNIYKGTVKTEDIPAATQLFTTDWVVRYMVDNSLGRYWIERNPQSELKDKLRYFALPKDQKIRYIDEKIEPQDLTFLDPCMGSGHILVYAFDVLMDIYTECGYSKRDAVTEIINNNLFGLDIDKRAYQWAYFSVMMKARQYDRRFFTRGVEPQVYCPQKDKELLEFGSLVQVNELSEKPKEPHELTLFNLDYEDVLNDWNFRRLLVKKYVAVCTNPPYLNKYNDKLKKLVTKYYKAYSGDLFSVFMYRNFDLCQKNGYAGFMTPFVWMFIKTYEKLREYIINNKSITTLIQMEYSAFEEATVPICSFVLQNGKNQNKALCFRLSDFKGGMEIQRQKIQDAIENPDCDYFYEAQQYNFSKIPGSPIAYWASSNTILDFKRGQSLGSISKPRQGMATTNNNRFLRLWMEVESDKIGFGLTSIEETMDSQKWFPYNKGGDYRKWYGNNDYIVNFQNKGKEVCAYIDSTSAVKSNGRVINRDYYFHECISWSLISSSKIAFRYKESCIFDVAGMSCFARHDLLLYLLGLNNSIVTQQILSVLAPTINYQVGDISNIPVIIEENFIKEINDNVENNIEISKKDWDSFEVSWDFFVYPLVFSSFTSDKNGGHKLTIAESFEKWKSECESRFLQLKANEEELNRIFIDIYGLQDELIPDVEDREVTVHRIYDTKEDVPESMKGSNYILTRRDVIVSLISYAVGCMFGRYSLDVEGLAYAGGDWDSSKYTTYIPDADNILPITDEEYSKDDIVGMFCAWVKKVYGPETLEENLDFIAKALGNKGNSSREVIRNYFLKDFFKDHCKTYQKRPIYWLFDSGKKNGFKALVYLHRYNADTIGNLRVDYLHRMQRIYESEINRMQDMVDNSTNAREVAASTKRKDKLQKQLKECREYDEKIGHLALSRIELDLDDGVKVNYRKVQTARDGKFYEVLADSKNIMGKQREK